MAPSASSRPVREQSTKRRGKARRERGAEDRSSTSSSSDDEADVARIRQKRTSYYDKTPEERVRQAKPLTQERRRGTDAEHLRRATASGSTTSVHRVGSSRSSVKPRRRRRREPKEEGRGGEYVYRSTSAPKRLPPIAEHSSSASRFGLGIPYRSLSQRTVRKVSEDMVKRRNSYHGETRRRSSREGPEGGRTEKSVPKRSTSTRESAKASSSKDTLTRSQSTKVHRTRPSLNLLPAVAEEGKLEPLRAQRTASVFGSLFGPARSVAPDPMVTCLTCMDDMPLSRTAKLDCGHRMCRTCLRRIFTMSVTDPAHMPPRCCTSECIPLKHVDKLFDTKFKIRWNRKYQEYTTKNRIYCPSRGCGAWIPPKDIKPDPRMPNRRYGKCARCRTKVCATCNNKWHTSRTCPKDEATQRFVEMAKEKGWQRCFNCKATVELKEGCNHMTCRCTAQFCMICGCKWKTCDCPWFNYATFGADQLEHMNIAEVRRIAIEDPAALRAPRGYAEEQEHRREQEQRDETLARRMQGVDLDWYLPDPAAAAAARTALRRSRTGPRASDDPAEQEASDATLTSDFLHRAATLLTQPVSREHEEAADQLVAEARARRRLREAARERSGGGSTPHTGTGTGTSTPSRRSTTRNNEPPPPTRSSGVVGVVPGRGRENELLVPRRTATTTAREAHAARLAPQRADEGTSERHRRHEKDLEKTAKHDIDNKRAKERSSSGSGNSNRSAKDKSKSKTKEATATATATKSAKAVKERPKVEQRRSTTTVRNSKIREEREREKQSLEMEAAEDPTPATLAGLKRKSTLGRVDAWRRHIAPGVEDAEALVADGDEAGGPMERGVRGWLCEYRVRVGRKGPDKWIWAYIT